MSNTNTEIDFDNGFIKPHWIRQVNEPCLSPSREYVNCFLPTGTKPGEACLRVTFDCQEAILDRFNVLDYLHRLQMLDAAILCKINFYSAPQPNSEFHSESEVAYRLEYPIIGIERIVPHPVLGMLQPEVWFKVEAAYLR